jgi:hypothetical protein
VVFVVEKAFIYSEIETGCLNGNFINIILQGIRQNKRASR